MHEEIRQQLTEHRLVIEAVEQTLSGQIGATVDLLVAAFADGKKVLIMGNGGSAADSQHFAAEIVGRFKLERRGLPAIALTTDSSILTALGNDYGFDLVFRRQVEALAQPGDVVIGISTSGTSKNVYKALVKATELGCRTIGLLGNDGGSIKELVDVDLVVPSQNTPRIQEGHLTIIHIVCDLLERKMFSH
jgi:D-sedoheptulose 7-phosphate isomerase